MDEPSAILADIFDLPAGALSEKKAVLTLTDLPFAPRRGDEVCIGNLRRTVEGVDAHRTTDCLSGATLPEKGSICVLVDGDAKQISQYFLDQGRPRCVILRQERITPVANSPDKQT